MGDGTCAGERAILERVCRPVRERQACRCCPPSAVPVGDRGFGRAPLAVWFVFTLWYTNTAGPLSAEEIASFAERAAADGAGPERVRRLLRFMKEDTGSQFLMVNLLDLATGEAASESMDRYMAHMLPEMLKRASHPTLAGNAVFSAMDHRRDRRRGALDQRWHRALPEPARPA